MHVVTDLFAFIAENLVRRSGGVAFHQVSEKTVKLRPGVIGAGETSSPETNGFHAKVAAILLHHGISSDFGCTEDAVQGAVNRHLFIDAFLGELVRRINFPARFLLDERQ